MEKCFKNSLSYAKANTHLKASEIKLSDLCIYIGILYVFKLGSISYLIPKFGVIYYGLAVIQLLLALFVYARGDVRLNKVHFGIAGYCATLLFSTYVNDASMQISLNEVFCLLPLLVTADMLFYRRDIEVVRRVSRFSILMISLNTLTALIFRNAMFRDVTGAPTIFLLGADNSLIPIYMVSSVLEMYKRNLEDAACCIPVVSLSNLLLFSMLRDIASGKLVGVLLVLLLTLAFFNKSFKFSFSLALGINITFFAIFVYGQSTISGLNGIFELLGRNSTFTERSFLWAFGFRLFSMSPLLGLGSYSAVSFNNLVRALTITGLFNTGNPHNSYLSILISGGLLAFSFVVFTVLQARVKPSDPFFNIFLFTFLLHAQVEGRDIVYIFFIVIVIYRFFHSDNQLSLREDSRAAIQSFI